MHFNQHILKRNDGPKISFKKKKSAWLSARNVVIYSSSPHHGLSPQRFQGCENNTVCEGGGTGRRARLRCVWFILGGSSPLPRTKNQYTLCAGFSFCAREGARTGRRHLCRKQSHSAALLSLRVPTRRNVYQGCTHFVPVSFCAREQTSNNTIYYIKESAMNSENSSRFFSYAGSGGRTTKNDLVTSKTYLQRA